MSTNRILNRVHAAQVVVICAIAGLGYLSLDPNQLVPIHWNIWGEVDNRWPAKWALLIGPVLSLVYLGFAFAIGQREKGSWLAPLTTSMLALFVLLETIMLLTGHDVALNVPRITTMAVGLLLAVVGNYLPKSQPNKIFGIRLLGRLIMRASGRKPTYLLGGFSCWLGSDASCLPRFLKSQRRSTFYF